MTCIPDATTHPAGRALRRVLLAVVCTLVLPVAGLWTDAALADSRARIIASAGVAVGGYDPVAYFTEGRAVPGRAEIALRWRGVRWHFATPSHRQAFEANPRSYAPQFGGHCAVGVSRGDLRPGNPELFMIHDDRLYLVESPAEHGRLSSAPTAVLQDAWQRHRTAK